MPRKATAITALAKVENTDKVLASLEGQSLKGKKTANGFVGYSSPYAIYVHENLQANHPVGEAKFLEKAARRSARRLRSIVFQTVKQKKSLAEGISRGLDVLLIESQKLVPVDTGFLKNSAFKRMN